MPLSFTSELKADYQYLFDNCLISDEKYNAIDQCVRRIVAAKPRYEAVSIQTGIPWYFIGIIHMMECGGDFTCHLHNGDPLSARTVHVPKNCPSTGNPPFMWEESAVDALKIKSLDRWTDWSVPGILFQFERYNGFGYRSKEIKSPYLWSFSSHYKKGKFTADGFFDPNAVSRQIGAAVLLRRMSERQIAITGESDTHTQIKNLGQQVTYDPAVYNPLAKELQYLLNSIGMHLRIDGKAGRFTSDAYFKIAGKYLKGDKRENGQ
jgi:lysozyme family protein